MPVVDNFIKDNSKWLLILTFTAGIMYGEFKNLSTVEERLAKKVKIINENTLEIAQLKTDIAVIKALNKKN